MARKPFEVKVPNEVLVDLQERLKRTRWADPISGSGWDYGTDQSFLKEFCDYWCDAYDWRAAEARINSYEQFLEEVRGVDLHFISVPGVGPAPFPLLLLHGWPGSVWEFIGVLDALSNPGAHRGDPADAFDLIVPSLPGFGFSGKPREIGWGVSRTAAAMDELMRRAGYNRYGVHGGDWGAIIGAQIGADHSHTCAALHITQTVARLPATPTPAEAEWAKRYRRYRAEEFAYAQVQRTKPDSLTVAQNDSPAGLAAWILEKFRAWGDTQGDIDSAFSRDDLMANVMTYWVTQSAPSAARMYYEMEHDERAMACPYVSVPTAVAAFPREPFMMPRSISEGRYNLVRWTEMPAGGHFAALERPADIMADLRAFFRLVRTPVSHAA